jgi:hypothetical protein
MIKLPKTFTKDEEISVMLALASGDTYFADTFTPEDTEQMISNVRNDFPLLTQTRVGAKISQLEGDVVRLTLHDERLVNDNHALGERVKELELGNGVMRDKLEKIFAELLTNGGGDLNAYEYLSKE